MRLRLAFVAALVVTGLAVAVPAMATTGKGSLFHDGAVVGTVVTPSPIAAGTGQDPFTTSPMAQRGSSASPASPLATGRITVEAGKSGS